MTTPIKVTEDYSTPRTAKRDMLNKALRRRESLLGFLLGCLGCLVVTGFGIYQCISYLQS